jgi:hypothetical protein
MGALRRGGTYVVVAVWGPEVSILDHTDYIEVYYTKKSLIDTIPFF